MPSMNLLAVLVAALLSTALLAVLARGQRLRDRLFRRLLLVALLPTMVVSSLAILAYSQALRLVEAPGIAESSEAALDLARHTLEELEAQTAIELELLEVAGKESEWPEGATLWRLDPVTLDALWQSPPDSTQPALEREAIEVGAALPWSGRINFNGHAWTAAARSVVDARGPSVWLLARPVPGAVASSLTRVQEGSRGLQQLRLYYGSLLRQQGWMVGLTTLILLVGASYWISRRLANRLASPIAELSSAMQEVAGGGREVSFRTGSSDELGDLQTAFGQMTRDLVDREARLRRSERLAAWRQVARRLAHEIKNPLTPIHLAVHRLKTRTTDPEADGSLEIILEETNHLRRLADEFSMFARLPEPRMRPVYFGEVLDRALKLYAPDRRLVRESGVAIRELLADEGQLSQVLGNLVKNAVEADPSAGTLWLRTQTVDGFLVFEIEDEGPGIQAPGERIFEPDFTTKSAGTGLGLAICRRICEDHGATLEVAPARGRGACLRLRWPLVAEGEEREI